KVTELAIEAVGINALPWQPDAIIPGKPQPFVGPEYALTVMAKYLNTRATSIYGGSNEIQRNIIAKMVLGL
ncbi:MAG TPA: acyl-CoA dehydrogenase family protein, partial [Pseudomonadales bacterium]|nr:acyl-CoA dehydrogenase family protein [Pseudomonadales bacterium]